MATSTSLQHSKKNKTKPRGETKKNVIPKAYEVQNEDNLEDESVVNLMTQEDELLLKDVEDDETVSDLELEAGGNDVSEAEIFSFMKKLGVEKYRPFPSSSTGEKLAKDGKNKSNEAKASAKQLPAAETEPGTKVATPSSRKKDQKTNKDELVKAKGMSSSELQSAMKFLAQHKPRKHLLLKPGDMWREEQVLQQQVMPLEEKLVSEAENLAHKLLEEELSLYSRYRDQTKRSEAKWLKTVLSSGTLSDKMAALTLQIQESPIHSLACIDSLIAMSKKKGRREAMMAVDTLRDLFLTGLLPDDRKLRAFNQQPLLKLWDLTSGNVDAKDKYLIMWYFEGLLKKRYSEFIKALNDMSFDTLQATKEKALSSIHQLLTSKPEQENILLPMLVNKLGDPSVKSKATYLLTKLVYEHPNMKTVIVREVQQLLHRPNVSQRAQYHAICFLCQLRLNHDLSDLASQLIHIYFYFFKTYLTKGDIDNKMMSALLAGVNRAYVYAKENKEEIAEQMNAVYKIVPTVNFHTSVQALMLLFQVSDASVNASDRYYTCLYRKLIDPALASSSKQAVFMNLLFKSMKADIVDKRARAFIKRTLQVFSQQPPQTVCAVLIQLSQLLKEKPHLLDSKSTAKEVWSDEEEKFVDLPVPEEFDVPNTNKKNDELDSAGEEVEEQPARDGVKSAKSSWVHRANVASAGHSCDYDPYSRNPIYSRAELECTWELEQLVRHYHPSVRLYASSVLQGEPIEYDGDAFQDYTLIRFLDKFVYKNPKKESTSSSVNHFKKAGLTGVRAIPVNSAEFLELEEEKVPEDEKFFHKYFIEKANRKKDTEDNESDGSVSDSEFDVLLDGLERDVDGDLLDDLDLDFAGDTKTFKGNKKKKHGKDADKESEDEDDDDDDDDDDLLDDDVMDEDLAAEFQEELEGLEAGSDDQEGVVDFDGTFQLSDEDSDDDGDGDATEEVGKRQRKRRKQSETAEDDSETTGFSVSKKKLKRKGDSADLFASAEEFAHLLEEDTETGQISLGGAGDFQNEDKAAPKQLKWEAGRERWLAGKSDKHGGRQKHKFKVAGAHKMNFKHHNRKSPGNKFRAGKNAPIRRRK